MNKAKSRRSSHNEGRYKQYRDRGKRITNKIRKLNIHLSRIIGNAGIPAHAADQCAIDCLTRAKRGDIPNGKRVGASHD